MSALLSYSWPGNVRELENRIERALIGSTGRVLAIERSPLGFVPPSAHHNSESLDDVQRAHITAVLEHAGWKVKGEGNAADRLRLNSNPAGTHETPGHHTSKGGRLNRIRRGAGRAAGRVGSEIE
jgi:DNA-binding NtrC family response regulator